MQYNSVGIAYVSLQWIFTAIALIAVTLRLYSRTLLTRSVGSDDFLITIAFVRLAHLASISDVQLTTLGAKRCGDNNRFQSLPKWLVTT